MTDTRTNEIRARHEAATPGPWGTSRDLNDTYLIEAQPRFIPGSGTVSVNEGIVGTIAGEEYDDRQTYCNARFAAHAREDVPYLLDRVAQLEALVDDFIDPDPCDFDHHGYCQAHYWFATDPACPHDRAKELGLEAPNGDDA